MKIPSLKNPLAQWNRNFALVAISACAVGVFLGVQFSLFNNFVVERLDIEPHHLGYVEALREVPGFLNALFIALMIRLAPSLVAGIALMIMGIGVMAYSQLVSVFTLALYSVIWSIGFHGWMPLQTALALKFSPPGNKGRWLGQLGSASGLSCLVAIGLCMMLLPYLDYEGLYILAGFVVVLGGVALLCLSRDKSAYREKGFVLKRRYRYYYALQFLQGCRRQMFLTFAIFAMVKVHGMPVETTMVLILINQVLTTAAAPTMGRMVDRYGERLMLSLSFIGLVFVFSGYAVVHYLPALYVLYCVDNLIFFGDIALTTYVHKIAPEEDLKPTLSMGVTMNHVAAVIAPVAGGLTWHFFGYEVIFFSGATLAFISLLVSQKIDPEAILAEAGEEARKIATETAAEPAS